MPCSETIIVIPFSNWHIQPEVMPQEQRVHPSHYHFQCSSCTCNIFMSARDPWHSVHGAFDFVSESPHFVWFLFYSASIQYGSLSNSTVWVVDAWCCVLRLMYKRISCFTELRSYLIKKLFCCSRENKFRICSGKQLQCQINGLKIINAVSFPACTS